MAASEMSAPKAADPPVYGILLEKVYSGNKDAIENDIAAFKEKGALNRQSAIRKIVREKGRQERPDPVDISGYFIQRWERPVGQNDDAEEPGVSVYIDTKGGFRTLRADSREDLPKLKDMGGLTTKTVGELHHWKGVVEVENTLTGRVSYRIRRGKTTAGPATQADVGPNLWKLTRSITQIVDGLDVYRAYVAAVTQVAEFKDGKKTGVKSILGSNGLANLSIGLTDSLDKTGRPEGRAKTWVVLSAEKQLRTFLGEYFDESMLAESDTAAREISDSFTGQSVIVFGRGLTPQNENLSKLQRERMKDPKIQLRNGQGVVASWQVPETAGQSE